MEPRSIFFFWLVELAKFCQLHFGLSLKDGVHQELHWCSANPGWSRSLNLSWHVSSWGLLPSQAFVRCLSGKRTRSPEESVQIPQATGFSVPVLSCSLKTTIIPAWDFQDTYNFTGKSSTSYTVECPSAWPSSLDAPKVSQ